MTALKPASDSNCDQDIFTVSRNTVDKMETGLSSLVSHFAGRYNKAATNGPYVQLLARKQNK